MRPVGPQISRERLCGVSSPSVLPVGAATSLPRDSMCTAALLASCGWPSVERRDWEILGRVLGGAGLRGLQRDSCHMSSAPPFHVFPSAGVDLSNIVKTAPKVSSDGLQEPTHDVLQVGATASLITVVQPGGSPYPYGRSQGLDVSRLSIL